MDGKVTGAAACPTFSCPPLLAPLSYPPRPVRAVEVEVNRLWRGILFACAAIALLLLGSALADPGSREDPLITVSYASQLASFDLRRLAVGQELKLRPGAEVVLVSPNSKPVNAAGLSGDKTPLINLTTGERLMVTALVANQHYVYGGEKAVTLRFDSAVTCLVRGEQQ
jgi:hypothetical protein